MDSDSELAMAINTTFNSIIHEIQLSNLNFVINVTPFAAYITLKKSTIVDKSGIQSAPSPPILNLLQNSLQEKLAAEKTILELQTALVKCEKCCEELIVENKTRDEKLCSITKLLDQSEASNSIKAKEIEQKEKEASALRCDLECLKLEYSVTQKEYRDYNCETELENKRQKKLVKYKEKEIHDLNTKLVNMTDTNANLKTELSNVKSSKLKLEKDVRRLGQKLRKSEEKKPQHSVSMQTLSTIDIPYRLEDPLPPIFGSNLCYVTKPVNLSCSMPDLTKVLWVSKTKDDVWQECAENALIDLYDKEVDLFYEKAKQLASNARVRVTQDDDTEMKLPHEQEIG